MNTVFYANINKKCISREVGSAPVDYMHNTIVKIDSGMLKVANPTSGKSGHGKIVNTGVRTVCARVHTTQGGYCKVNELPSNIIECRYNPVAFPNRAYFWRVDNDERVTSGTFYVVHDDTLNTLNNVKLFVAI